MADARSEFTMDQARVDSKIKVSSKSRDGEGGFLETVKVVIQALLIAVVVRTLLFQPFNIPSGSLIPTLLIGDYLFVSKYFLRLFQALDAVQPALFSGPHLGLGAEARRHRGVQAARRTTPPTTSSG
jgi:signal peptidase I